MIDIKNIREGDEVTIRGVVEWVNTDNGALHCRRPDSAFGAFFADAAEITEHRPSFKRGDVVSFRGAVAEMTGEVLHAEDGYAFVKVSDGQRCSFKLVPHRDLERLPPTEVLEPDEIHIETPPSPAPVAAAAE